MLRFKQLVTVLMLGFVGIASAHAFDDLSAPQNPTKEKCRIEKTCPNGRVISCFAQGDSAQCHDTEKGVTCLAAQCTNDNCKADTPVTYNCK